MKKNKRGLLALGLGLATAVMTVGVAENLQSTVVYAEDTVRYLGETYTLNTNGDWQYIVKDNAVVIMGYTSTAPAVTIPSEISGRPVVAIGKNGTWNGKGAFQDNNSMQTVTIPASVTYIDASAFQNCTGLQQVLIGDGVTEIGASAFADCSYLQRVQIKGATLEVIGDSAFARCEALDNFTIPESVKSLGDSAFAGDSALSYIKIPDSVIETGGAVFAGCTVLAEAVIGDGVTVLGTSGGDYTAGVERWKTGFFENCSSLAKVTIGSGVETIGIDAFAGTGLLEINIPDNVVTIDTGAFYNCNNLKTAVIGAGVKTMGDQTFAYCKALESVTIGNNVRTMGVRSFTGNDSLKEIRIPSSVISLGGASFSGCTSLTKAVIGNGVTELGTSGDEFDVGIERWKTGMFESCTSLTDVSIGNGVTTIGADAFAGTALVKVVIPDNVVTISTGAFANCKQLQEVLIGDGVTSMGDSLFSGDTVLSKVHIGKGVVDIGSRAFYNCSELRSLIIPSNVTSLGGGLCLGCSSLEKVIIGNGVTTLSTNGDDYNSGAERWKSGTFESCSKLQDVALGSGLTSIGADTFAGTAISSLLIPAKVSSIDNGAFWSDTFRNIYFTGPAPEMGKLFNTNTPALFKMMGKTGYDSTGYTFNDFTPITVTFDLNDDDVFAIQPNNQYMMPEGGYVIEPISPMAEGYRFLGWYKDRAGTQKWDFQNNRVTADTTIYASWAKASEVIPEAPKALTETKVTGNTVTITWEVSDGATSYDVYVNGVQVNTEPITDNSYIITGLEPDSTYEITVAARNEIGVSEQSLVKVVQTEETEPVQYGDVDGDGEITADDALNILKSKAGLLVLTDKAKKVADVDGDGEITSDDALDILKKKAGLIDKFAVETGM